MKALVLSALLLAGCTPTLVEGRYACSSDPDCPSGWRCVDGRCYSHDQGQQDAGPRDAGPDGGAIDGGAVDGGRDRDAAAVDGGRDGGGPCLPAATGVDLLLMVDNSRSMAEEQASLVEAFPDLVDALARGDADGDGRRDFVPVSDLHVGVVTSDMGTGGHLVPTCFDGPMFGDDGILQNSPSASVDDCPETFPTFLSYRTGDALSTFRRDFACIGTVGIEGCGFEQQLEAVLKAVTPSTSPIRFFNDTTGHGDGANRGFLRRDSVLVVLMITDENDCSAHDLEIFRLDSPRYAETDLNLRCFVHGADVMHPVTRYVDGLAALRADHPERLVFGAITGVPLAVEREPLATILAHPDMEERAIEHRIVDACTGVGGAAGPGLRMVETAQGLEDRGSPVVVRSICQSSYREAMGGLLRAMVPALRGTCE